MLSRSSLRINALTIPQPTLRSLTASRPSALYHRSPSTFITIAQPVTHQHEKKDDGTVPIQRTSTGSTMQSADKKSFHLRDSNDTTSLSNTNNTSINRSINSSSAMMDPITQLAQLVQQVQPVLHQLQQGSKMLSTLLPRPMREAVEKNVQPLVNMTQMMVEPILNLLNQLQPRSDDSTTSSSTLSSSQPLPQQVNAANDLGDNVRIWDFNSELVNPVRGIELNEKDERYEMKVKFADWVSKNDIHSRLVRIDNSEDGLFQLQIWGGVKRQMKSDGHRTYRELSFRRAITLPKGIDAPNLKCEFVDGSLHIELPKREGAQKEQEVVGQELHINAPKKEKNGKMKMKGMKPATAESARMQFGSDGSVCSIHEGCESGSPLQESFDTVNLTGPSEPATFKPQYD